MTLRIAAAILLTATCTAQKTASPAARDQQVAQAAAALKPKLMEIRRDLHMHPELSNREERTGRMVAEHLRKLGYTGIKTGVARTGVVAILKGGRPGPVIAIRADMDALPITETMDVPYKSQNPGVKHACGHDVHTAVGLGVAELLFNMRDQVPGTIKFIFQPAEEGPPAGEEGGAPLMIKQGVLQDPAPQAIFALHVMPQYEVGSVAVTSGPAMASSDRMKIVIRGRGVHAAYPHQGNDPVVIAAEVINVLQTIRSRRINTLDPVVVSIGKITGGTRHNIIPDEVVMEGTIRTLDPEVKKQVHAEVRRVLEGVTAAFGAKYELEIAPGTLVTFNDPQLSEEVTAGLRRVLGAENVKPRPPQMGAEDFSYFHQSIPGHYYFLGVGNQQKNITAMIHTAEFDVDEDSITVGVKTMATIVLDYLERNAKK
jgi:amidohydrolase